MKSNKNKIIVFANQNGGVGKSTLCILLANYLAYWKKDVCIIDTDLQQSATLQREQDKQAFGEEEPYSIQPFDVSDPKTMQMLMENAQSQDGFVLFDAPGTIKDDGLAPMFIYADYIICPYEYEPKSLTSTRTFIQVINRLRQLNPHMKVQFFFVPNKVDARMGTHEEQELWKQMDAEFSQSGIIAPPVGYRAQMKRVNTYIVPLPLKHAVYESFRFIVKSILR
jgi:chromosome partitioning protein